MSLSNIYVLSDKERTISTTKTKETGLLSAYLESSQGQILSADRAKYYLFGNQSEVDAKLGTDSSKYYHKNKFDRGFTTLIDIWGADHHGHVMRMKGAMDAIGYDGDKLNVVLMQLVKLVKNGEIVRMSKRTGKAIQLGDLLEEVPVDSARFLFNTREANTQMDFDLDLAVAQDNQTLKKSLSFKNLRSSSRVIYAICKGGHLEDCSDDLLYSDGEFYTYPSVRIDNPNTHGTGCTLSSAIASNLAKGFEIPQAVENAKAYVTKSIGVKLDLGKGRGPLMHNYILQNFK